jgi:hypothetical protein
LSAFFAQAAGFENAINRPLRRRANLFAHCAARFGQCFRQHDLSSRDGSSTIAGHDKAAALT